MKGKYERIERIHFAESSGLGDVKHDIVTFFQSLCQVDIFSDYGRFQVSFLGKIDGIVISK